MKVRVLSTLALSVVAAAAQQATEPAQLPVGIRNRVSPAAAVPITAAERARWFVSSTVGPASLASGVLSAGWGTAFNQPEEYGGTWEGFGKRYGIRLTGVATGNAMEAGFGAIWGEDPRYVRSEGLHFGGRVKHIIRMTFLARRKNGSVQPAYARMVGTFGNNFLSWTWRVESEKGADQALLRSGLGILGRMGSNSFAEFWPDIRRAVFRR